jgi:hypothetical protein
VVDGGFGLAVPVEPAAHLLRSHIGGDQFADLSSDDVPNALHRSVGLPRELACNAGQRNTSAQDFWNCCLFTKFRMYCWPDSADALMRFKYDNGNLRISTSSSSRSTLSG